MRTTLKRKFRNEYFTCPDWSLIPFHCSIRSSFPHWTVASGRNCGIRHCDDHPVIQRSAGSYRDWPAKSAAAACEAFRQPTGVREFRNEPNVNPNWDARNGPNWMTAHLLLHQPSECNTRKRNTIPNKKHKREETRKVNVIIFMQDHSSSTGRFAGHNYKRRVLCSIFFLPVECKTAV